MQKLPIYFDYMATTPLDSAVSSKMMTVMGNPLYQGNPSAKHRYGEIAQKAVEDARSQVAALLNVAPREIIFTSGATESNYIAILGAVKARSHLGRHLITSSIEHKAVLALFQNLEKEGYSVTYLSPNRQGFIEAESLRLAFKPETIFVSLMHVNNEIGTINPLREISQITAERGIWLHVDGAQSVGKLSINLQDLPIDLLSLSGHKIYGPKGTGALFIRLRPRVKLRPILIGGGQEQGLRAGTLATHQIVGLGEASFLAKQWLQAEGEKALAFKEKIQSALIDLPKIQVNGDRAHQVPHCLNLCFQGCDESQLEQALAPFALSKGSACMAFNPMPSYVLQHLGLSAEQIRLSRRIAWGRGTTALDIETLITQMRALYREF